MESGIRIVALTCGAGAHQTIESARGCTGSVVRCSTADELVCAAQARPCVLVWDLQDGGELEVQGVARRLRELTRVQAIIVRIELTRAAGRQVLAIAAALPVARLSIQGHDDLRVDVAESVEVAHRAQPEAVIAGRVLPHVPEDVAHLVATAIVAGRRRMNVDGFAQLCRTPVRTIQWALHRTSFAPAHRLLGYCLALHAVWRLELLDWPVKRIAIASGFQSHQAWSAYVSRHTGAKPARLVHEGGFSTLLSGWRSRLLVHPPTAPEAALDRAPRPISCIEPESPFELSRSVRSSSQRHRNPA